MIINACYQNLDWKCEASCDVLEVYAFVALYVAVHDIAITLQSGANLVLST